MIEATCLVARASGTIPDGSIRFPDEFFVTTDAFTSGQVLNFGSLAYVADCYGALRPLNKALPASNESPPLPPSLLGADLEVLAR